MIYRGFIEGLGGLGVTASGVAKNLTGGGQDPQNLPRNLRGLIAFAKSICDHLEQNHIHIKRKDQGRTAYISLVLFTGLSAARKPMKIVSACANQSGRYNSYSYRTTFKNAL